MKHWIDRSVLSFWTEKEMRIEAAHLLDLCEDVLNDSTSVWTPFLSQALLNWLEGILRRENLAFRLEGGIPEPERARFVISTDERLLQKARNEITVLFAQATDPKGTLEHRQVLGSLIGLGIKREVIGDIRPGQQGMYVAVSEEISEVILHEWKKAGREKIQVQKVEGELELLPDQGEERRITVASSRLDAVAASSFNVSRTVFQELITQGKVKRNDLVVSKIDMEVKPGDVISCRGYGRIRLSDSSETRKGRIAWNIFLYRPQRH
jgi:RNA-binding protein YlmH